MKNSLVKKIPRSSASGYSFLSFRPKGIASGIPEWRNPPTLEDPSTALGMTAGNPAVLRQKGQAVVTLLFFMILSVTITTAAVMIVLSNAASASTNEQGGISYYFAESGAEEGLLRLLRNPAYTGETITFGNGNVVISVADGTITATGSASNTQRTIQVKTVYDNSVLSVTSWKEL